MEERLSKELSDGGGSDVILLGAGSGMDFHKLAKSGAFCDLSEYIDGDAAFSDGAQGLERGIRVEMDDDVVVGREE